MNICNGFFFRHANLLEIAQSLTIRKLFKWNELKKTRMYSFVNILSKVISIHQKFNSDDEKKRNQ